MTVQLKINHLTKKFKDVTALDDINLELHSGEVLGYIGPNGAGKSTTIRSILGILRPSMGSVEIFGMDAFKHASKIHEKLSYVPGDVYLWPNLTGGQTIDLLLKMNNQQHTNKTDKLIKDFGLDITKKNKTYSKGNRQKVALIAAFSTEAEIYIFDEPTSGLDPLNEEVFQNHLLKLKQQGKSILLSSHILSEVEKVADRIAIIKDGQIVETGTLEDMQYLTSTLVEATTKDEPIDLKNLSGVNNLVIEKNHVSFQIDAKNLNSVISYLTTLEIIKLKTTKPTLEQIFLQYYKVSGDK
ncbi:ABC transporter ATP-binding protein [Companilactobacillus sp. RD055328]|uniref:ABC transporter ATP-binding protein n=1 Tax=Companilactobacillus sp. RD055328 TaxID=2916634 RepID=UPI001FC827C9|nr:ABC transporter ATP-binding protein [Companilactobacillus sp. RD055328]GKQ43178.1 ABC transporter ATP-binding protein [Companilactobacillus sp. RD055328]